MLNCIEFALVDDIFKKYFDMFLHTNCVAPSVFNKNIFFLRVNPCEIEEHLFV